MFRAVVISLAAPVLLHVLAGQVPVATDHYSSILRDDDPTEWALDKSPNPDTTDHLVFETVHSLLQHWPNTRMRNGHNIVPGVIPQGTLLYHAGLRHELPSGPEWMALDPEHAFFFCGDVVKWPTFSQYDGCWQITFVASKPLKIVYFDGNSGAKLPTGPLDTQDLVLCENSPLELWDEPKRAECLCAWGKHIGVDGFVRMQVAFEIIFCDFTSGVSIISFANLVQPSDIDEYVVSRVAAFESVHAGTWHDRFPGETRIQLDLTELISFYDTQLAPSLVPARASQERWDHRVQGASHKDLAAAKSRLETALMRPAWKPSRVDWKTLLHVIVDRFSARLELMRHLLRSSPTSPDELLDIARKTQMQLRIILTPYLLFSAMPTDQSDEIDLGWTSPIYKLCATTHTRFLDAKLGVMTDAERLILRAVQGTNREICRVVTTMWAAGVYAGLDPSLNTRDIPGVAKVMRVWDAWSADLDRLMMWLDWSVWIKCTPECAPEELCYLPTWPLNFPCSPLQKDRCGLLVTPDSVVPRPEGLASVNLKAVATGNLRSVTSDAEEWVRPQPTCVKRLGPFEFEM